MWRFKTMDEKRIEKIQQIMEGKSTTELQKILEEHDTAAWIDEAFEAVRRVLAERGDKEPNLDEPRLMERPRPTDNRAKTGLILASALLVLGAVFLLAGKDNLAGAGGYLAALGIGFVIGGIVGLIGGLILLFGRGRK
jgi:hypothetical protein